MPNKAELSKFIPYKPLSIDNSPKQGSTSITNAIIDKPPLRNNVLKKFITKSSLIVSESDDMYDWSKASMSR